MQIDLWAVYDAATGRIVASGNGSVSDEYAAARAGGDMTGLIIWRGKGDPNLNAWMDLSGDEPVRRSVDAIASTVLDGALLADEKDARVGKLWAEVDRFIQRKPNGRPRYDHNFKAAANALDKSAMTTEQLAKYGAVFAWVDAIWTDVYYPTKAAIDAAETITALEAISWDLSPYEVGSGLATADPDVSLTELRS